LERFIVCWSESPVSELRILAFPCEEEYKLTAIQKMDNQHTILKRSREFKR